MTAKKQPGDQAGQKARTRARNQEAELVTGIKPTRSGTSSGHTLFMSRVLKRDFADIEDQAVFVGDLTAVFGEARKTTAKTMIVQMTVPGAYQHELLDMVDACAMGFVMVRCYYVPRTPFMPEDVPPESVPPSDSPPNTRAVTATLTGNVK